jgi:hypothetical protein
MNGLGFNAWPDRLFLGPRSNRGRSRPLWVEFKRPGEAPTPLQRYIHADLRARGERVEVIDRLENFKDLIHEHFFGS